MGKRRDEARGMGLAAGRGQRFSGWEKLCQQGQSGNDMSPAKTIYHMFDASLPGAGTTQGMT